MATPSNSLNINQAGYVVFDGTSSFSGRTFQAGAGITLTNASGVAGNTTITASGANDLHTAKFIVSSEGTTGTGANFTTITAAIASAVGTGLKSTIFIMPGLTGTYTENFTLPANINLTAYNCDMTTPNVTIIGKITCTDAGKRSISGIRLQTNSDNILAITGSAATVIYFNNCFINATNNTAFSITSSNVTTTVFLRYCEGDLGTTGITYFTMTHGTLYVTYSILANSNNSTTASTFSNESNFNSQYSTINIPVTTSNTASISSIYSEYLVVNVTGLTINGTGQNIIETNRIESGSGSAISIGTGASVTITNSSIKSTNTNAITGLGTIVRGIIEFFGTSSIINTSTQTYVYSDLGKFKAPGQPAFLATLTATTNNVTGDSTTFGPIVFDSVSFDQNSNYNNSTGVFTAPVTGKYQLNVTIFTNNSGVATIVEADFFVKVNATFIFHSQTGITTVGSTTSLVDLLIM